MRQLESLHKWNDQNADSFLEKEAVLKAVGLFHPDHKYDPATREHRYLGGNAVHLSGLWEQWERNVFSPDDLKYWARLAIVQGYDTFADWGSVDHRRMAMITAVQLAAYEGDQLRVAAFHTSPPDILTVWKRLYWFTRFFRAWGNICMEFTPSQFASLAEKAKTARAWKRAAWSYYTDRISKDPKLSVRTVATNFKKHFKKQCDGEISIHEVQVYLGNRMKLLKVVKSNK